MTNSYAIIRAIAKIEGMTPAERWAGAMIAVHLDTKRNQIRVRQSLIAEESGLKERCVRGAVAKMVAAGIFRKVRTQKGLVLVPTLVDQGTPVKESVNIHRHVRAAPTGMSVPVGRAKAPWEYDLELSSRAEEEHKRQEARFALEEAGGNG